eukprot:TRINITY_DN9768_c0_g1_i3.p1 TRINITY_DN9768_c0_g1~~TRINITY_DN9768_c0_g1_i3.p1  ORF type:complete len:183 (-),score=19.81 TRINITY_DN9768_c0_g1_i3:195-743(-)
MGSGASGRVKTQPSDAGFDGLTPCNVEHKLSQQEHRVENRFSTMGKHMSKSILGRLSQHESGAGTPPKVQSLHSLFEQLDRRIIEDGLARLESKNMDKPTGTETHEGPSLRAAKPPCNVKVTWRKGATVREIQEAIDRQIIDHGLRELEIRKRKGRKDSQQVHKEAHPQVDFRRTLGSVARP